jgi:hypothetical protein
MPTAMCLHTLAATLALLGQLDEADCQSLDRAAIDYSVTLP